MELIFQISSTQDVRAVEVFSPPLYGQAVCYYYSAVFNAPCVGVGQ